MTFRTKRYFFAIISSLLMIGYSFFVSKDFLTILAITLCGMAMIIFSEPLGNMTGLVGGSKMSSKIIDKRTPPIFIEVFGWVLVVFSFYSLTIL